MVITSEGVAVLMSSWVEAKDAARHFTMYGTTSLLHPLKPKPKNFPAPNINSAAVEKLYIRPIRTIHGSENRGVCFLIHSYVWGGGCLSKTRVLLRNKDGKDC